MVAGVVASRGVQVACWGATWLGSGRTFDALGVKGALILIFFILPMVSAMVCSSFACTEVNDGLDHYEFMTVDKTIMCSSTLEGVQTVNPRYTDALLFATIMIFVWPIGMPLAYGTLLWHYREKIAERTSRQGEKELATISFLFRYGLAPPPSILYLLHQSSHP